MALGAMLVMMVMVAAEMSCTEGSIAERRIEGK